MEANLSLSSPPSTPLLAYLGDDFTGSTDVMEATTAAGLPTILFLQPPTDDDLTHFAGKGSKVRCIGLASTARSQSPAWMDAHLPDYFARLKKFGAPILQYKVCSTFDSSAQIGSIGRALEIGQQVMNGAWMPVIVGVPQLKRFQVFGNLFATVGAYTHRLDRHPTMRHHPTTPMLEADLRLHLAQQTTLPIELIDVSDWNNGKAQTRLNGFAPSPSIVLLDVMDEATQAQAGELIWQNRGSGVLSASSSGLPYALVAHWRKLGWLPALPSLPKAEKVDAIAVVSGSCSPVTAQQIEWAGANGFALLRLEIAHCLNAHSRPAEIARLVQAACAALAQGKSPVVFSALGTDDAAVVNFDATAQTAHVTRQQAAAQVGETLAQVMRELLDRTPSLRRVVVAGGDSSGAVVSQLAIQALSVAAALSPGAPLCRAWSRLPQRDGLQIVLKGGQMGGVDFFGRVLNPD